MIRKIIRIDEEKCNGCGACASACHEGAIGIVDGKARLLRDDYCDGFGDCLPACPTGAISFEEREAAAYDEAAVKANRAPKSSGTPKAAHHHGGCPGARAHMLSPAAKSEAAPLSGDQPSQLRQWPVQIRLVPPHAPFFDGARLLISADCAAYAFAGFHERFIRGHITLIGCPKLDGVDYADKLTEIIASNDIKSVTVVRMEVPCCGGIEQAAKSALKNSGKFIPWQVVTLSAEGKIID